MCYIVKSLLLIGLQLRGVRMNNAMLCILFALVAGSSTDEFPDDFKCELPDVQPSDTNLDIERFRSDFAKISEVKFPGVIGQQGNNRKICKIKCVDGDWVGPLCSDTVDGKYQPILRECRYRRQDPLIFALFNHSIIMYDTMFPHGTEIAIRCVRFGVYKLTGEKILRCENGEWSSKMPTCVPTTVISSYAGGAPPTIEYSLLKGNAVEQADGQLYVLLKSTVVLDCMWRRSDGTPEWSSSHVLTQQAAWASGGQGAAESEVRYRLPITNASPRHSASYTCTAPTGSTNTVWIKVVNIACGSIIASAPNVKVFSEGSRLGDSVHFSCEPGYHINGSSVVHCMGDGRWSDRAPVCVETVCPAIRAGDPHVALVEYNPAPGGRAVFACSWGYRLVGAPGLECEPGGRWSAEAPRCLPIYCPEPLIPDKGRLVTPVTSKDGKYPVGDLVIYSCQEGCDMVGESSIVCTENGFWSHPPPFCIPPSEIRKSDTIYVDNTTLVNFESDTM